MSTTKLTGRENLTKNTFCVGPVGPSGKENQVKMYKSTIFGTVHYLFETVGSESVSNSKDPDPCQIGKQDPYQKGLDLQHCHWG
jgi:hypothetical protein